MIDEELTKSGGDEKEKKLESFFRGVSKIWSPNLTTASSSTGRVSKSIAELYESIPVRFAGEMERHSRCKKMTISTTHKNRLQRTTTH